MAMDNEQPLTVDDATATSIAVATMQPAILGLTLTEQALLLWLAAGRTNAQIGRCTGRSEKTIRNQLTRLYAKLEVGNRAEAVAVHLRAEFGRDRYNSRGM